MVRKTHSIKAATEVLDVLPVNAGGQKGLNKLDAGFRRNDEKDFYGDIGA